MKGNENRGEKMIKEPDYRFSGYTDAWEQRKLGELADIVRGSSPRPIQDPKWFDTESDIGWLRISDVTEQDGRIYNLEQRISKLGQEKTRVLLTPHLLLSIAASVGKPVVNYVKTGVHDGFLIFLNPKFEQEFMFQWLDGFKPKWQKYGQPGSQVNLNSDLVRNQEIHLPSLPEQTAIGTFFQTLDRSIALHQRKLDSLKEQKKTYLQKLFPRNGETIPEIRFPEFQNAPAWEQRKLGETNTFFTDGNYGPLYPTSDDLTDSRGVPFLRGSDLSEGVLDKSKANFITHEKHNELKSGHIELDDIVIAVRGSLGAVGYAKSENVGWNINSQLAIIRTDKNQLKGNYLIQYFLSTRGKNELLSRNTGTALKQLPINQLKTVVIPLTSIQEQTAIGNFFQTLDRSIAQHQTKLDKLKESKQTLLKKMFV